MKKTLLSILLCFTAGCTTLSGHERIVLRDLKADGISVDKPTGEWVKPASPLLAGVLNILPGFGNFYLGMGNGADGSQSIYGVVNLLLWPISPIWGIPQAVIDAKTINERDLVFYYEHTEAGQEEWLERQEVSSSKEMLQRKQREKRKERRKTIAAELE